MHTKKSDALDRIIGHDAELWAVLSRGALVAPTAMPVLVTGESGTGKELLARALHELGAAPAGPFVAVNCGALPRELAESELFGHERGAFTGAAARRRGWFEEASGGTLVLDEIGELPLELQPKLLRVLETGRIRRVGGAGETPVSVRVVAMTLRNLKAEAQRGAFRADLYYRLAGIELALPPLRRRRGDIPRLVEHFLRELEAEIGPREIDPEAVAALTQADWPGNVRELRNVVRRAAILTGGRIDRASLELPAPAPFRISETTPPLRMTDVDGLEAPACGLSAASAPAHLAGGGAAGAGLASGASAAGDIIHLPGRSYDDIEREVFAWALRRNGGSRRRAARALSVARSTFCDRVKRYKL
jgi:two-component system nitrogen regulation response regulator GlnG